LIQGTIRLAFPPLLLLLPLYRFLAGSPTTGGRRADLDSTGEILSSPRTLEAPTAAQNVNNIKNRETFLQWLTGKS